MPPGSDVLVRLRLLGQQAFARGTREGAQDLDRFGRSADRAGRDLKGLARVRGRLGTGSGLSLGALGAGGAVIGGLYELGSAVRFVAGEYTDSARVGAQTRAAIESTGGAARVSARHVERLAGSISRVAGVDDEAIQSGANLLLTFKGIRNEAGRGNDVFDQTTKAAVDMAAALGSDPRNAAMQLGKALNDPEKGMTRLTRSGVTFTKQQTDQVKALVASGKTLDAQRIILGEVTSEFGGSAAAQAQPIDKLRTNVGNLAESIGTLAAPAVNRGIGMLSDFVDDVTVVVGSDATVDQKMARLGPIFERHLNKVGRVIERMDLGGKLASAIEYAAPIMADAAARAAPGAARAFVNAFREMGPWGKLLTVGLVAGKLGAFSTLGSMAATGFAGMMRRRLGGKGAGSLASSLCPPGTLAGKATAGCVAAGAADNVGPALESRRSRFTSKIGGFFRLIALASAPVFTAVLLNEIATAIPGGDVDSRKVNPADPRRGRTAIDYFEGATGIDVPFFGRAGGGVVRPGEWTLFGEHGPELGRLPAGTRLYPRRQSARMLGTPTAATATVQPMPHVTILHNYMELDGQVVHRSVQRVEDRIAGARHG